MQKWCNSFAKVIKQLCTNLSKVNLDLCRSLAVCKPQNPQGSDYMQEALKFTKTGRDYRWEVLKFVKLG